MSVYRVECPNYMCLLLPVANLAEEHRGPVAQTFERRNKAHLAAAVEEGRQKLAEAREPPQKGVDETLGFVGPGPE